MCVKSIGKSCKKAHACESVLTDEKYKVSDYFTQDEIDNWIDIDFIAKIGRERMIVDPSRIIDRYGLRYAFDIIVSFENGKLNGWSFIEEDSFDDIESFLPNKNNVKPDTK